MSLCEVARAPVHLVVTLLILSLPHALTLPFWAPAPPEHLPHEEMQQALCQLHSVSFLSPLPFAFQMSKTVPSFKTQSHDTIAILQSQALLSPPKASGSLAYLYYIALFALNHQHLCPFKR